MAVGVVGYGVRILRGLWGFECIIGYFMVKLLFALLRDLCASVRDEAFWLWLCSTVLFVFASDQRERVVTIRGHGSRAHGDYSFLCHMVWVVNRTVLSRMFIPSMISENTLGYM